MRLPALVLKKMSARLKSKSDEYLKDLLNHYEIQLLTLNDEDYKYYSKPIKQKIDVVKAEMYYRIVLNSQQIQN